MPILRSGRIVIANMATENHNLFRVAFEKVNADAQLLFPEENEASHRADFIKMHRESLLKEFGFTPTATNNSGSADFIKNFVSTCNKFDNKNENMSEFFERVDRKFATSKTTAADKVTILDILLPNHFYLPYETEKTFEEQYIIYKNRALVKAKCTPIDILYKVVNLSFRSDENFEQIFSKCKYNLSKCMSLFPDIEEIDIMTWIFLLKSFPKQTRNQLSQECRPSDIKELPVILQRFASIKHSALGGLLYDQKTTNNSSNKPGNIKQESNHKTEKDVSHKAAATNASGNSKSSIPNCDFCNKRGHVEQDCFLKHPEKRKPKSNPTVNNTCFSTDFNNCIEILLEGQINGINCNRILLDSGAQIPAFHPRLCKDPLTTNDTLKVSCMSKNIIVGNYKKVTLRVTTPIYDAVVEGICVPDLHYDCILPLMKDPSNTDKNLLVNLNNATVSIVDTSSLGSQVKTLMDCGSASVNKGDSSTVDMKINTLLQEHHIRTGADTNGCEMANGRPSNTVNATEPPAEGKVQDGNISETSRNTLKATVEEGAHNYNIKQMTADASVTKDGEVHNPDSKMMGATQTTDSVAKLLENLPKSITLPFIVHAQNIDPFCRNIFEELKLENSYKLSSNVELVLKNNAICKVNNNSDNALSLFVPKQLVPIIIKCYHDDVGHISYNTTAKNISNHFYFENLYEEVKDYVNKCSICQKDTTDRHHKAVPSGLIELTDVPFAHIALDYITHLDTSHSGNSYLLTVIDVATRYANVIPVKTLTAEESLDKLFKCHFYKYGFPSKITTDNGRQFTSHLFSNFCKDYNIEHIRTSPMHPNSNGICERFNGTISNMIKHSCQDDLRSWDEHVDKFVFTYNNTVRSGTKFTPHELVLTYIPRNQNDRNDVRLLDNINLNNFVINKNLDAVDNRRLAKENLIASQLVNKDRLDKNSVNRTLQVGDSVVLKAQPRTRNKMEPRWQGPYKVVDTLSDKNYIINKNNQRCNYHIDLLKLYKDKDANVTTDTDNEFNDDSNDELLLNNIAYLPVQERPKNITVLKDCGDVNAKQSVKELIDEFPNLFSNESSTTNTISHEILLTDTQPVQKLAYPIPLSFREQFKKELDKLVKDNIIEPSHSDYSSPCIIVPKKNSDEIRLVIDYRALNAKLVKDREPINNSQSIFASLNNCKYFSTIDLKNGFWQIRLKPESRKYTAFITEFGLFQFKVMPFGISTGPAVFSRMMRMLFQDVPNVYTFLDDILIATETLEQQISTLKKVFKILTDANLKVNLKKSHFCVESIDFLGQTLNANFIAPQQDKIDSISNFPLPNTKKNLQRFLGLCNYYRNYVKNYAELAHELYDLVKKNAPKRIIWTDKYIDCFTKLKSALSQDIKLFHLNANLPLILQTDASAFAIGAVLGQRLEPNGPVLPIQCISKKLNETQQRYSTIEREAYAVVWAVEKLSFYLLGNHFIIESDHQPLSYLKSNSKSKDKLRRWEIMLHNFDFEINYIAGKENHMSDCLSRLL